MTFKLQGEAYNLTNTVVFRTRAEAVAGRRMLLLADEYNGFGVISTTQSMPRYLVVAGYLRF